MLGLVFVVVVKKESFLKSTPAPMFTAEQLVPVAPSINKLALGKNSVKK